MARAFVTPRGRGQGLGLELLTEIERIALTRNIHTLRLDVRADLVQAQRLYLKAGYTPVPVPAFNDSPWAGHWFAKVVTA